jgi:hypothetical protein
MLSSILQEFKGDATGSADLYAEERAAAAAAAAAAELQRKKAVPGLLNPYQQPGMDDDDL